MADQTIPTIKNLRGNIGIGTASPSAKLHVVGGDIRTENRAFFAGRRSASEPSFSFHDDSDTGMFNIASNILAFATSGSERVRIASDGLVTFAGTGGGALTIGSHIDLGDSQKVRLGASDDLQLYHDGNNSKILNTTGYLQVGTSSGILYLDGNNTYIRSGDGGEYQAKFIDDGQVELFHNNVKKFETTADGIQVTGDILAYTDSGQYFQLDHSDNSLKLSDNVKLKFGTGMDFQIFHTGTNTTMLDQGTGALVIASNNLRVLSANQSETLFEATEDGAVELYHNNVKKFETTTDGATITGNLLLNSAHYVNFGDATARIQGSNASNYLKLYTGAVARLTITNTEATFSGDLVVSGGLTINGTTTTIDTTNLLVEDKNIVIGNVSSPSDTTADGGGITLKGASDYTIAWSNSTDYWTFNQGIEIDVGSTNAKGIKIGNDSYDASIIPTSLGGVAVSSSDNFLFYLNGAVRATFTTDGKLNLPDSGEITLGAGNDLKLHHNGTNSYIQNETGDFRIEQRANDGDMEFYSDDGSGGIAKYFHLDGGDVRTIFSKDVRLLNDVELAVGTNKALSFVYDGANSSISNYYGDLYIDQNNDDGDIRFRSDNGSGGLAEYFRIDGGANQTIFSVSALLQDGVYLHIGTGSDLQLYHDATNSNITNNTGDLVILNTADDKDILLRADDGSGGNATYIQLDGSVTRNKLLQHTSLPDGKNLILGAGDDLQLYHNGSDSYIFNYTGSLYIKNEQDDGDIIFQCDNNSGGVETYFYLDGSINSADAHTVFPDSSRIILGSGTDTQIYHDGSNSYISHTGTGDLYIQNSQDDRDIVFQSDDGSGGTTDYLRLDGSDSIMKAHKKLRFLDNVKGTFGNADDLQIYHDGTNSYVDNETGHFYIRNKATDGRIRFVGDDGAGGEATYFDINSGQATHDGSATTMLMTSWYDNSRVTFGNAIDMQIWHDGTDSKIYSQTGDLKFTQAANDKDIIFECDDGSGGTETYFFLDGSVSSGNPFTVFPDLSELAFGTGRDLRIKHNGTDSYISETNGDLYIRNSATDKDIVFQSDDGSGGETQYIRLDGSTGLTQFDKDVLFTNTVKAKFGNSSNLMLYSDGTDSYAQVQSGDFYIQNIAADKDIIFQADDGSGSFETYFYLDGSLSSGEPNTVFPDNSHLRFGTGADLDFVHDGSNTYINNSTGDLYITNNANDKDIIFRSDDGSGGNETYFFLDGNRSSGAPFTVFPDESYLVFGDSLDFLIRHNGTDTYISNDTGDLYIRQDADDKDIIFQCDDGSGGMTTYLQLDGGSALTRSYRAFRVQDDVKLQAGSAGDLDIKHSSNNSFIENHTGHLYVTNTADDSDINFRTDDGSGGVATYFHLDGGEALTIFSYSTRHNDNVIARWGTGNDLNIYHDGSSSIIQNATGHLDIKNDANDADVRFFCDDGSNGMAEYFRLDGGATDVFFSKNLRFNDNTRLELGAGSDTKFYHTGTYGIIDNFTGDFYIRNHSNDDDIHFQCDDGSGGGTTYFRIDGGLADGTNLYTVFPDNSRIRFGDGLDLDIHHDGSNSYINQTGTGNLYIQQTVDGADMVFKNDDGSGALHEYMRLDGGMYHVVFSKSTQHADGAYGKFGNGGDLQLSHNGTNSFIKNTNGDLYIENSADDKDIIFKCDDGSGGTETYFYLDGSASAGNPFTVFPDNSYLALGTGTDLLVYHDGTDSWINNATGDLYIRNRDNDKDVIFQSDDGSGGVATYFSLDGSAAPHPRTTFPDNSTLQLGSGGDLQILNDGNDSFIRENTRHLYIQNTANDCDIYFQSDDGSGGTETYFFLDGSVSSGNPVTKFPDNSILALGTSGDFYHYHDGTNSYHANYTGDFYIDNNANDKDVILRSDDGSGGVTAYITLDGSATDIKFSKNVDASSQNIVAYYLEGTYKSFLIDHPTQEGKKLRHGCLEGPEHGVYFRGKSSDSIIECPEYWMGLVEEDSVTVQLTAIGPNQNIYVDHIDEDGNIHVGSNTDEPLNYYYTVNGERKGDKVVVVEDA